ncbi:MAG: potassium channel protein [Candidatus Margulisbacteria bacterium]|nr:potassium channel protein [Candidatus Margulisiibacteriota bacterium]MBU1022167.1 potassium channel protein [Candidatus Margulisiibacteriota bacterium]MBU1729394.1 potassium channel protein [Candidatus Margulisiibacteriota bacterium]MBU1955667.1 potassium channel protein [Candidatus Margulisiibacteriota bacterium]
MNPLRRLGIPFLFLGMIIVLGVLGYKFIEGVPAFDALYMVVITLSTVGFNEVVPLSNAGKLLTIFLIVGGVGTVAYTVGQIIEIVVEGQIVGYRRRRQMEKRIASMKDHYIICGFGRVGHQVAEELTASKESFVVVDVKQEIAEELAGKNIPYVIGSPASDESLEDAGVKKAKVVVACHDSDADNVFVVLSARVANPKVYIIARAGQKETESKLLKAGANRVISPYFIAGRRMAAMALRPITIDYLDTVMRSEHVNLGLREFLVREKSKITGKALSKTNIRQDSGATVLAIRKPDGAFNLQPISNTVIESGDLLITIGTPEQLELLDKML